MPNTAVHLWTGSGLSWFSFFILDPHNVSVDSNFITYLFVLP
jgi:hypothetical protein